MNQKSQPTSPTPGEVLTPQDVALLSKGDVLKLAPGYEVAFSLHANGESTVEDVDPVDGTITVLTSKGRVDYFSFATMPDLFVFVSRPASEQPVEAIGAGREAFEEAIRLAEVGEFLIDAKGFAAGNGYDEPRELSISWDWQQSKPDEYGMGVLLAEATRWHDGLAEDGVISEARKLRAALSPASPARTPMGGRVDGHGGVTWPAASADLASEEGLESIDALVDMARVGVNLMERLPEGYAYSDCPTEIVTDLQNKLDEAKTPMGGEVEALREALEPFAAVADEYDDREDDTFEVWMDAGPVMVRDIREALRLSAFRRARQALAASSPSPAQGGIATWHPLDDNGMAEVRINGKRITTMPSYPGAEEVAQRINAALSASPQPEAGEASEDDRAQAWLLRHYRQKAEQAGFGSLAEMMHAATHPSVQPVEGK